MFASKLGFPEVHANTTRLIRALWPLLLAGTDWTIFWRQLAEVNDRARICEYELPASALERDK
jgi:hypothetical protein